MRVLGLDLGKKTGWAIYDGGVLESGAFDLSGEPERLQVYRRWFALANDILCTNEDIDCIVFEDPRFNRGFSYIPGMTAMLTVLADEEGIPIFPATVQEVKMHATGKGNASKDQMHKALVMRGFFGGDIDWGEDAVDAAWAAIWMSETATVTP